MAMRGIVVEPVALTLATAVLCALALPGAAAPVGTEAEATADTPALRTAWGDPDFQGIWSNATLTPLERPDTQKNEYLTEEEAATVNANAKDRTLQGLKVEVDASGELNDAYMELGQTVRSRRTSLVVDPPDGKVPYTPEGRNRRNLALGRAIGLVPIYSYEDRGLNDRCLLTGGLMMPNPFYLNNHQIFQTRDTIAIKSEVMNETRVIPLDRKEPLDPRIELWSGASRGRFEGDELVIETANFNGKGSMIGGTSTMTVVERFKRVDERTIDYQVTIADPATFTQPWTLVNTLRAVPGPIYEYGCHEGNYGLVNILEGAAAQAKAKEAAKAEAAAQQAQPPKSSN